MKVFVEETAALAAAAGPRPGAASLEALLAPAASPYGRAYLAGTHLADGAPPRIGLTALACADAWRAPLLAWAGARSWVRLGAGGALASVPDPSAVLAAPDAGTALAVGLSGDGALQADALQAVADGDRGDALRALLDAGAAVLAPEPAHDGWDWSVFGPAPLGVAEVVAAEAPPPGVVRFVAPLHAARGEHKFYFEQWTLDPPPPWATRV